MRSLQIIGLPDAWNIRLIYLDDTDLEMLLRRIEKIFIGLCVKTTQLDVIDDYDDYVVHKCVNANSTYSNKQRQHLT